MVMAESAVESPDLTEAELEWEHLSMAGQAHRNLVTRTQEGLKLLFRGRHDRLVLGEVTVHSPTGMFIPDVAVVAGLPQADYASYRIDDSQPAPSVVIEVVSPYDTDEIAGRKLADRLAAGVNEVWFLFCVTASVTRFQARGGRFVQVLPGPCEALDGVWFDTTESVITPRFADGTPFPEDASVERFEAQAARAAAEAARAAAEAAQAAAEAARTEAEAARAEAEAARAEAERLRAIISQAGLSDR